MEIKTNPYEQEFPQEQESILEDAIDTSVYEKTLKNARIWLYVLAGLQAGIGVYEYATTFEPTLALIVMGIDMFVAAIFLTCALWSRNKPVPAFTTALIFYILFHGAMIVLEPTNIFKGILIKVFVIIALIKANRDARAFVAVKNL